MKTEPDGQMVLMDGKVYKVTPDGDVYVDVTGLTRWRKLNSNGRTALAVKHQARYGH